MSPECTFNSNLIHVHHCCYCLASLRTPLVLSHLEGNVTITRAAGTGQAGQAKAGPLFLDSPLYGIDRPIIVLGNDRQASIFVH